MTYKELVQAARERWLDCCRIADKACAQGIAVTPSAVNRRYDVWQNWDQGRLSAGYLFKMTGAKKVRKGKS